MPRAVTPATGHRRALLPGAASGKEPGPALWSLSGAGRTMAAGGTVTMEPPAKTLWRPTLQLQVLGARPHPFCSKTPPELSCKIPD